MYFVLLIRLRRFNIRHLNIGLIIDNNFAFDNFLVKY